MLEIIKEIAKSILKSEIDTYTNTISSLDLENTNLKDKIEKLTYSSDLEQYYDNKYPTSNISYNRTDMGKTIKIDVRNFIQPNDFNLPIIEGKTDDEIAYNSLKWVKDNIMYVSDKTQYGMDEYWSFPYQVINSKKDDCESGAVLLASIMIKNGIKPWKVRVTAGNVIEPASGKLVGHCFVCYFSEEVKRWVLCDWCYFYNNKLIKDRTDYKDEAKYKEIWFSFSMNKSWGKEADIRKAEELLNGLQ